MLTYKVTHEERWYKMKKLISLLLCAVLIFSLVSCDKDTVEETPVETGPTAGEIYTQAAAQIETMDSMSLDIAIDREMTVGVNTYVTHTAQTLNLQNIGTETFAATLEETTSNGHHILKASETLTDGKLYATFKHLNYTSDVSEEDYLAEFAPAVILNSELYGSVEQQEDGNIVFTSGTALENWVDTEDSTLIDASGFAELDENGNLKKSSYTANYTKGAAEISIDVAVTINQPDTALTITAPADTESYIEIDDWTAPKLLANANSFTVQAESIDSTLNETLVSQAIGGTYTYNTDVDTYINGEDELAKIIYSSQAVDMSSREQFTYSVEKIFRDGFYTAIVDGDEPTTNSIITYDTIRSECQNYATSIMPDLSTLSEIDLLDAGNSFLIQYTGSDAYAEELSMLIAENLFDDANALNDLASEYRTEILTGYVGIDKSTGLPTAASVNYVGYHTIDGTDYLLSDSASQTLYLGGTASYESITGETLPMEEPAEKATPLFYHVTSPEGEEMWLLGTIHAGDERTSYLPQEIYDAFNASDSLAVEVDLIELDERMATDPELAAIMAQSYYYTDGTTTLNHIQDEELGKKALQMMQATGNFNTNTLLMKPYLWSQTIDNYYIQQGYEFSSDNGVDMQLLQLAKEQDKDILEVESGEFQIQLLTGYSDEIQEMMLATSIETPQATYNAELRDLYEKWCKGDESILSEAVKDDTSDLTEDELALYEEYNEQFMTDRNAAMLEAAKEYLESGKTVFYAVGLAHLLNDDGLVNTLRNAGYTVELVAYA
ncbi:MAG: TraB/GumN family protein [Ruminococcaceae bacterium]|nr:TraB/GumN family protein [Oscillospiraceae bacterium]